VRDSGMGVSVICRLFSHYHYEDPFIPWICFLHGPVSAGKRLWNFVTHHGEVITAVATSAIAWFTWTLWKTHEAQLRRSQEVERAYLSAGGSRIDPKVFHFNVSNHGRTKATLFKAYWGFVEKADIWKEPPFTHSRRYEDLAAPQVFNRGIFPIDIPQYLTEPAIYGKIEYKDIWEREFYSRFVLDIQKSGHGGDPIDAPPAMTKRT